MGIVFTESGYCLDEESAYAADMCALSELAVQHFTEYEELYQKYYDLLLQEEMEILSSMGMSYFDHKGKSSF